MGPTARSTRISITRTTPWAGEPAKPHSRASTSFGYDPLGQLTLVTLPGGDTIQYEYDAAGNRIAVVDDGVRTDYTTNDLNQYTQVGSGARTYDVDGNLISEASGGAIYTYDDENRLVSFADAPSNVQYEYDSLGSRVAKVEGGVRIEYLPDPTGLVNVVAEYDASGNPLARYVYGGFGLLVVTMLPARWRFMTRTPWG